MWPDWITSQIIGFIAVLVGMYSLLVKRKTDTLMFGGFTSLFIALSVALLLNWVVFFISILAAVRNFLFAWFEYRKEKGREVKPQITFAAMLVFIVATIVAIAFTWEWWFDWILLVVTILIIYGSWAKGIHKIRIALITFDTLMIINFIIYFSILGIIMSAIFLSAGVAFYMIYFYRKRKSINSRNIEKIERVEVKSNDT